MAHNLEPSDAELAARKRDVLAANVDDPRFTTGPVSDRSPEWTDGSAVIADLTEPVDDLRAELSSPPGIAALLASGLQVVLETVGALLNHWGR